MMCAVRREELICDLCGSKSTDMSPFDESHGSDMYASKRPWIYKTIRKTLTRVCKLNRRSACANVFRAFGEL